MCPIFIGPKKIIHTRTLYKKPKSSNCIQKIITLRGLLKWVRGLCLKVGGGWESGGRWGIGIYKRHTSYCLTNSNQSFMTSFVYNRGGEVCEQSDPEWKYVIQLHEFVSALPLPPVASRRSPPGYERPGASTVRMYRTSPMQTLHIWFTGCYWKIN